MDYDDIWKEIFQIILVYILYLYPIALYRFSFSWFGHEFSDEIVRTCRTIVTRSPLTSSVLSTSKDGNAD